MIGSVLFSLLAVVPSLMNDSVETVAEPQLSMRPWTQVTDPRIEVSIPSWAQELGFTVREKTEIKAGDSIRAVIKNPKTGENMSTGNEMKVQY